MVDHIISLVTDRLATLSFIEAIVLGGSRARGTIRLAIPMAILALCTAVNLQLVSFFIVEIVALKG